MTTNAFAATLEGFLTMLAAKNRSAATLRADRTDVAQCLRYARENEITVTMPAAIDRAHLADYLAALGRRGLTGVSRARKLAALREYFRYLVDAGVFARSPAAGLATPKKERTPHGSLRPEEYTKPLSPTGGRPRDFARLRVFL